MPEADVLITFGPMMKDEVLQRREQAQMGAGARHRRRRHHRPAVAWQADVVITNIRGIHGEPVSEAAIMAMLALSRRLPDSVRAQDKHSWTRWAPQADRSQDRRHLRRRPDRRGAGAALQGARHDGGRLYDRPSAKSPGFDRMHLRSEFVDVARDARLSSCCWSPIRRRHASCIDARVFAAMKPTSLSRQSRARRDRRRGRADRGAQERHDRGRRARRVPGGTAARRPSRCGRPRTSSSRRISAASATSMPSARCRRSSTTWPASCAAISTAWSMSCGTNRWRAKHVEREAQAAGGPAASCRDQQ